MRRARALALSFAVVACSALHEHARLELGEELLAKARALRAEERAPIAFRRFHAARHNAEKAPAESAARSDAASEARLWLEVALAEAETAALSDERLGVERQIAGLEATLFAAERAQRAREDEQERAAAAEIARSEAERALTRASEAPAQRVRLSAAEASQAARSLLARAELIELALPETVDPGKRGALKQALADARAQLAKAPERALVLADEALFGALALAGSLRKAEDAPSRERKASLAEALTLAGARVERTERGLSAAFSTDKAAAERQLGRLCTLISAYPDGQVELGLAGRPASDGGAAELAKHGCEGARIRARFDPKTPGLRAVFTAY